MTVDRPVTIGKSRCGDTVTVTNSKGEIFTTMGALFNDNPRTSSKSSRWREGVPPVKSESKGRPPDRPFNNSCFSSGMH